MPRKEKEVEYESFDVTVIAETTAAILVKKIEDAEEHWIPKSLLHPDDNEVNTIGDEGTLVVPVWFAEKEGL